VETSGPLKVASRDELRAYMASTLAGKRHGWGHLAIRHNSVARLSPCRFCDSGTARPDVGPAIFWDADPICDECAAEVAPALWAYLQLLRTNLRRSHRGGGPHAA